jgi:hypothetical protein
MRLLNLWEIRSRNAAAKKNDKQILARGQAQIL